LKAITLDRKKRMSESLITKYRPRSFEEVIGHEDLLRALQRAIAAPTRPHNYLFTGVAGLGKTSLARIVADKIGAEVLEVDGASQTGIDSIRALIEVGQYRSLSGSDSKMYIIDECHRLSKPAWDALLKTLEEPPEHLYFALCTTEPGTIKETIITRCYHVPLKPLPIADIELLLDIVCEAEEWKPSGDVIQMVIAAATGQPRKALSMIQAVHDAKDRDEAKRIISLVEESEPFLEIMRHLASGKKSWEFIRNQISKMGEEDFDSMATQASSYISKVMLAEANDTKAKHIWSLLDALVFPASTYDRKAAFVAAIGRMLWAV
jgi:DNA polymerase III gamma/tau subunit